MVIGERERRGFLVEKAHMKGPRGRKEQGAVRNWEKSVWLEHRPACSEAQL